MSKPHVVIVGGGIAGLAAAYFLRDEPVRVTVLEGSPRLGGKLTASEVAGVSVDAGAEALLRRRPEGTDLISAVGPGGPAGACPAPRPRPSGAGAPCTRCRRGSSWACPRTWTGWPPAGCCRPPGWPGPGRTSSCPPPRATATCRWPPTSGPGSGHELVDRLVDPLLGGVYAGPVGGAVVRGHAGPAGRSAAGSHRSLAEAVGSLLPAPPEHGPRAPGTRPRLPGPGVHHADRRAGCVARGGGGGLRRDDPDPRDGPRAGPRPRPGGG